MSDTYCGDLNTFNMDHGYNEALVRGYKSGFLTDSEYHHIAQCENIEGRDVGEGVAYWDRCEVEPSGDRLRQLPGRRGTLCLEGKGLIASRPPYSPARFAVVR